MADDSRPPADNLNGGVRGPPSVDPGRYGIRWRAKVAEPLGNHIHVSQGRCVEAPQMLSAQDVHVRQKPLGGALDCEPLLGCDKCRHLTRISQECVRLLSGTAASHLRSHLRGDLLRASCRTERHD